jgi:hypothetical protein
MNAVNYAAIPVYRDALDNEIQVGDLISVAMLYGQSSGTQYVGWVVKLPSNPKGKLTIKLLKRGYKGRVEHKQPFYAPHKIVNLSGLKYRWNHEAYADVNDI